MNPNPYRTALLVLAIVGIGFGVMLAAFGAANYPHLGPAGLVLVVFGAVMLTLWLVVSAIIYGIAVTPTLPPKPTYTDWLGTPAEERPEAGTN